MKRLAPICERSADALAYIDCFEKGLFVKQITVEISNRESNGSAQCRRLRAEGKIPAVVYARGQESIPSAIVARDFTRVASQSRSSQIFTLKSTDSRINGKSALVKEVQKDKLKDNVLHVDFLTLRDDEKVTLRIPLKFVGESLGVKNDGGLLSISTHDVEVSCLPKSIPDEIQVDVSSLLIGQGIHASQLPLTSGVELAGDPEEVIVSVVIAKVMETATATPAATADGTAATPAEGAAAEGAAATPAAGATTEGGSDKK